MKKVILVLVVLVLGISFKSLGATAYHDWSDPEWENKISLCVDNADYNSDGLYDIKCTVSGTSLDASWVYYIPPLETNTNLVVRFKYNTTTLGTFNPSWFGLGYAHENQFGMDSVTWDSVEIYFYSDFVHMYDSDDCDDIMQDTLWSENVSLKNAINRTDQQRDDIDGSAYTTLIAQARIDGINSVNKITDLYSGYGTTTLGADGYDDTSYNVGYSAGNTADIDYSVFTNLLQEMGGLFQMEIMPNITIGMLASIPIAFALLKWFLKLRG